jgi:RHS repeat-associated protein
MTAFLICEYHFTGKERDGESGNDYFGARYYASSMGRFTSPDPSGLVYADPTNPQGLNLYNYVLNNPLINVDPNGLDCLYAQDSGSVRIQTGDCTNAGGKDDDGVYVNGTVNSATQDDQSNVTSYSTDSGSFLADGTPNNTTVAVTATNPDVEDDRPGLTAMVKGVARRTAGFPTVCSVGFYGQVGVGDYAVGGSYDSKKGGKGYGRQTLASNAPFSVTGKYDSKGHLSGGVNIRDPETGIGVGGSINDDGHVGANASIQRAVGYGKVKANATGGVSVTLGPIGDAACRNP